jgi:hypothetical protein
MVGLSETRREEVEGSLRRRSPTRLPPFLKPPPHISSVSSSTRGYIFIPIFESNVEASARFDRIIADMRYVFPLYNSVSSSGLPSTFDLCRPLVCLG